MDLNLILDQLLNDKELTLYVKNAREKESMRTMLQRKLRDYKKKLDSIGYASDETLDLSLGCKLHEEDGQLKATFTISPGSKKNKVWHYEIIDPKATSDA